jgi:DNA segregation ATPase FtsK/SpoIIIE, S-DNA-T family
VAKLLGIDDVAGFDSRPMWASRSAADRLRVPIGIDEDGGTVELDIKESAQGGNGPHGVLIGATGSGKSELLRTLVLSMAITHSSETLAHPGLLTARRPRSRDKQRERCAEPDRQISLWAGRYR